MATLKFTEASAYTKPSATPPESDYLFRQYMKNLTLTSDGSVTDKPIGVALFGLGNAGTIHLGNLATNSRVRLLYIVDDVEERSAGCKNYWRLDGTECLKGSEADQVFNDPEIKAVIIATPTMTHETLVTEALLKGKYVFCEKPVAQDLESARRCYEKARNVGKPLFTAFNRRFDPSFSHVRDRVRSGEVGHVTTIKVTSKDSVRASLDYIRVSGGICQDSMVHDIDMMTWILGEFPTRVVAIGQSLVPEIAALGDYDSIMALLSFPSGTTGFIDLSRNSVFGYDQRVEVFGPRGLITMHNERPMPGVEVQKGLLGSTYNPIFYSSPSRFKLAYQAELEHFLDVVDGKTAELLIKDYETLAVTKIAGACHESAKTGTFVDITWEPEEIPSAS